MFSTFKPPFMKIFGDLYYSLVCHYVMTSWTINESMIICQTYRTLILIFIKHRLVFSILEVLNGLFIWKIDILKLEHYLS